MAITPQGAALTIGVEIGVQSVVLCGLIGILAVLFLVNLKRVVSVTIKGRNIGEVAALQVTDLAAWVRTIDDPGVAPLVVSAPTRS